MDSGYKRCCQRGRFRAIARRCFVGLFAFFSLGCWSQALAELAIEVSGDSEAAWNYTFSEADTALLDEIQKGCFKYFWNEIGRPAMLAKDKTSDSVSSIAAIGFQLSSLPIGVERGWITRDQGEERAITILSALRGRT